MKVIYKWKNCSYINGAIAKLKNSRRASGEDMVNAEFLIYGEVQRCKSIMHFLTNINYIVRPIKGAIIYMQCSVKIKVKMGKK